jgi:hypothetical protein
VWLPLLVLLVVVVVVLLGELELEQLSSFMIDDRHGASPSPSLWAFKG